LRKFNHNQAKDTKEATATKNRNKRTDAQLQKQTKAKRTKKIKTTKSIITTVCWYHLWHLEEVDFIHDFSFYFNCSCFHPFAARGCLSLL